MLSLQSPYSLEYSLLFFFPCTKTNQTQMAMELWVIKVMNQIQPLTAESLCFQLWSVEPLWEASCNPSVSRFISLTGRSLTSARGDRAGMKTTGRQGKIWAWVIEMWPDFEPLNVRISPILLRWNMKFYPLLFLSHFFPPLWLSSFVFSFYLSLILPPIFISPCDWGPLVF